MYIIAGENKERDNSQEIIDRLQNFFEENEGVNNFASAHNFFILSHFLWFPVV